MPPCCAVNCTNRKTKNNELAFYRIPKTKERREKWLQAIKRKGWGNEQEQEQDVVQCPISGIS